MVGVAIEVRSSGNAASYPGKLTPYVILTVMAGAAGGLIFGYDLGISGKHVFSILLLYIS